MNETDYLKQNWLKLIILAPLAFLIVDILLMYMGISGLLAAISVMILTSNMLGSLGNGGIEWLKNLIGL